MPVQIPKLDPGDARIAELVFEFVQFLLDEDANLTPAGNLTGSARQKLRARIDELIAAEEAGGQTAARMEDPAIPDASRETP
jgi:hypothetical protein